MNIAKVLAFLKKIEPIVAKKECQPLLFVGTIIICILLSSGYESISNYFLDSEEEGEEITEVLSEKSAEPTALPESQEPVLIIPAETQEKSELTQSPFANKDGSHKVIPKNQVKARIAKASKRPNNNETYVLSQAYIRPRMVIAPDTQQAFSLVASIFELTQAQIQTFRTITRYEGNWRWVWNGEGGSAYGPMQITRSNNGRWGYDRKDKYEHFALAIMMFRENSIHGMFDWEASRNNWQNVLYQQGITTNTFRSKSSRANIRDLTAVEFRRILQQRLSSNLTKEASEP